jgi:catechol 2,3-dioxygenase-like lactoylglutathione lyase family enzyme
MTSENHHLFVADRDGTPIQLSSPEACGAGEGRSGVCNLEPAPSEGLIQLREINHFTTFVANYQLTNDFYRSLFDLQDQAFQGAFPLLGLGDGRQFLMFVGGTQPGAPRQAGRIDHVSLNIDDFTEESVLQRLTQYGLTPRVEGEPAAPLQHWVSRRMPERGGAPGGTPEVYFSDPDGIHIQLQHLAYCGGGGVHGEDCSN